MCQSRHVDLGEHEFPFSRGCSFYEVDNNGKIKAARDIVEQAIKPGSSALYVSGHTARFSSAASCSHQSAVSSCCCSRVVFCTALGDSAPKLQRLSSILFRAFISRAAYAVAAEQSTGMCEVHRR